MIIKNIKDIINVASKRYFILWVYVSFGIRNKPVNHLPIAVNGTKLEIIKDNVKAITKFVAILGQSIVTKEIVKTPASKSVWADIAEAKQRKNETGMSHTKLYTNNESLNLFVIGE